MKKSSKDSECSCGSSSTTSVSKEAAPTRFPYDELSHEVEGNVLSVRVAKNIGKIKKEGSGWPDSFPTSNIRAVCEDAQGNKCRAGCAKVNVIANSRAPAKLADEESFLLRATRQILASDEMRNSLEIELRTPRNYRPLPPPTPCPIVCPAEEPPATTTTATTTAAPAAARADTSAKEISKKKRT